MPALWKVVPFLVFSANLAVALRADSSPRSSSVNTKPERVKVYSVGPEVAAPQLLPFRVTGISPEKCVDQRDGTVVLSIIVDSAGLPRNITFLHPLGTDVDKLALLVASLDRFTSGTQSGAPVAVAESLELSIQSCVAHTMNDAGKAPDSLRLTSEPVQKLSPLPYPEREAVLTPMDGSGVKPQIYHIGGKVTGPVLIAYPAGKPSQETKPTKDQGTSLLSVVIDAHGMPQDVQVMRSVSKDLDKKAIDILNKYRFKPAMKGNEPVAVGLMMQVNFKLY